jgi:hypothetical protein
MNVAEISFQEIHGNVWKWIHDSEYLDIQQTEIWLLRVFMEQLWKVEVTHNLRNIITNIDISD